MEQPAERRLVAVVNASESVRDLVASTIEDDGYRTMMAHADDFIRGRASVGDFLAEHDPAVVVWDVSPPYESNWLFLQGVIGSREAAGRGFVITTTNLKALSEAIGEGPALELIGKPFDLEEISAAVKKADRRQSVEP
jgi:DNA-binding NtrC family response regulator